MALSEETFSKLEKLISVLMEEGSQLGLTILHAFLILIVGHFVIKLINRLVKKLLSRKNVDPSARSFIASLINVILIILLAISVIGALGVQTASFAALLASIGVAIGMALSGNLSNFAGGLIILLFKPFKVGDYISNSNVSGTVVEIQTFHTILNTPDNIRVFIPNGILSSGFINNYNVDKRRIEWIFEVGYGENFDQVREIILDVLSKDSRIMTTPAYFVELNSLAESSVSIVVRVWVKGSEYWDVYYSINKEIYKVFDKAGIDIPFPQLTIHKGNKTEEE